MDRPLFDEPPRVAPRLSVMYSAPPYRCSPDRSSRYVKLANAAGNIPCDECFANQHESSGASGPRAIAKNRRSFLGGPRLNLCHAHTVVWRQRDEEDQ